MFFSERKTVAVLMAAVLLFVFAAGASAFSVDIDPNAGEDSAYQWDSSDVYGETGVADEYGSALYDPDTGGFFVEETTREEDLTVREPLAPELCMPSDDYLIFENDGFSGLTQIDGIERAMKGFYKETGVQPCLLLSSEKYDDGSAAELLKNRYEELFDSDGGHLLLLFSEPENEGYCGTWCYPGADADGVVTYDACERLAEYIDRCSDLGFSFEDTFCRSFELAADYVMYGKTGDVAEQYTSADYTPEYWTGGSVSDPDEIIGGADKTVVSGSLTSLLLIVGLALVFVFCIIVIIGAAIKKNKQDRDKSEIGKRKSE